MGSPFTLVIQRRSKMKILILLLTLCAASQALSRTKLFNTRGRGGSFDGSFIPSFDDSFFGSFIPSFDDSSFGMRSFMPSYSYSYSYPSYSYSYSYPDYSYSYSYPSYSYSFSYPQSFDDSSFGMR